MDKIDGFRPGSEGKFVRIRSDLRFHPEQGHLILSQQIFPNSTAQEIKLKIKDIPPEDKDAGFMSWLEADVESGLPDEISVYEQSTTFPIYSETGRQQTIKILSNIFPGTSIVSPF